MLCFFSIYFSIYVFLKVSQRSNPISLSISETTSIHENYNQSLHFLVHVRLLLRSIPRLKNVSQLNPFDSFQHCFAFSHNNARDRLIALQNQKQKVNKKDQLSILLQCLVRTVELKCLRSNMVLSREFTR